MQDAGNENSAGFLPVEHDVPAMLDAAQARPDIVTGSIQRWMVREAPATRLQLIKINDSLACAPSAEGILGNAQ